MNLFRKLFFSNQSKSKNDIDDDVVSSKYMPTEEVPVDEQFMLKFKEKGGKFLYCSNEQEALDAFNNILLENEWHNKTACCFQDHLKQKLTTFNLKYTNNNTASFYIANCEYLIAEIGGILVSSNQLTEKRLGELPDNFIIIAFTSQLTRDISEGLRGIKNNPSKLIPTNITTIQHFQNKTEKNFLNYGSCTKNVYLLLIEDL